MTGEGKPVHHPALHPGGVDIEYAEADWQTDPAVDDLKQIRVLGRVVAFGVAGIAVRVEEDGIQVAATALQRLAGPCERRHVFAQTLDMIPVALEGHVRRVEGAEQQRRIGQVNRFVREATDGAECTLDRLIGHQGCAGRRGSSFMITWLTTCFTPLMRRACAFTFSNSSSSCAIPKI